MIKDIEKGIELSKKPWKRNGYFYATDVASCGRKVYYDFTHPTEQSDYDPKAIRIFENGDATHSRLIKYLRDAKTLVAEEFGIQIKDPVEIHGRIDGLIVHQGEFKVLEIKSISDYGFKLLSHEKSAKWEHIQQANIYMHMTHQKSSPLKRINKAIILYENKNTQVLKSFEEKYNPKLANSCMDFLEDIENHVKQKKLPERGYERTDWQCKYCKFNKFCWKAERAVEAV